MTKKAPCIERPARRGCGSRPWRTRQRGDALLEAMIGALLLAIIGMGLTYAAARVVNTQRFAAGHHIVLTQVLNELATKGVPALCDGSAAATVAVKDKDKDYQEIFSSITLAKPDCPQDNVTITLPTDASLPTVSVSSLVTRMTLSTPDDAQGAARALLGPGSLVLSQ